MKIYIYKIKNCNYIGSTHDIRKRLRTHNSNCYNINRKEYNYKVYKYIRKNNIKIELKIIRTINLNIKNITEKIYLLYKRKWEQVYINIFDSKNNGLNSLNAYVSEKQKKQRRKEYYNRPEIYQKQKENKKINDKKFREKNPDYMKNYNKKYREKNRDEINAKARENYQKNRDEINAKARVKVPCPICNKLLSKDYLSKHIKKMHK